LAAQVTPVDDPVIAVRQCIDATEMCWSKWRTKERLFRYARHAATRQHYQRGKEARKVPILNDIPDHEVIGPEIKKGIQMGELQGELKILRRQIKKRFGTVPNWRVERLVKLSAKELEELSVSLVDAKNIESLLK
jgi:Domain of unknown function (DUF4351)